MSVRSRTNWNLEVLVLNAHKNTLPLKTGSIVGAELRIFLRRNISSLMRSRAILTFVITIEGLSSGSLLFLNNRSINLPCDVTVHSCGDKRGIKTIVLVGKKVEVVFYANRLQEQWKNNRIWS